MVEAPDQGARSFTYRLSFSHDSNCGESYYYPPLQMRSLRLRKVYEFPKVIQLLKTGLKQDSSSVNFQRQLFQALCLETESEKEKRGQVGSTTAGTDCTEPYSFVGGASGTRVRQCWAVQVTGSKKGTNVLSYPGVLSLI